MRNPTDKGVDRFAHSLRNYIREVINEESRGATIEDALNRDFAESELKKHLTSLLAEAGDATRK